MYNYIIACGNMMPLGKHQEKKRDIGTREKKAGVTKLSGKPNRVIGGVQYQTQPYQRSLYPPGIRASPGFKGTAFKKVELLTT